MISLLIEDIKPCMNGLLKDTVFDGFLLHSFDLKVLTDFHVDGEINRRYADGEAADPESASAEKSEAQADTKKPAYISWKEMRPVLTEIIKAYRTPLSMQISFILTETSMDKVLKNTPESLRSMVQSFSFRLHFENNLLRLITATNYKGFLPDKSAEHSFDVSMKQFLAHYGYVFREE